VYSMLFGGFGY
ncbi:hypothetical protein D047_1297B, partial [Vibrio parahaemolyticus VPTS-2010_2]